MPKQKTIRDLGHKKLSEAFHEFETEIMNYVLDSVDENQAEFRANKMTERIKSESARWKKSSVRIPNPRKLKLQDRLILCNNSKFKKFCVDFINFQNKVLDYVFNAPDINVAVRRVEAITKRINDTLDHWVDVKGSPNDRLLLAAPPWQQCADGMKWNPETETCVAGALFDLGLFPDKKI
ncbi:MAG: hypothetical protein WA584_02835 [Pyrinomonadaceae bacterium]